MKNVNIKKCIRENSGITLTTLVITVIVLLILAGVATSTGIEAIENTKHTKFVAELKIMQSHVNQWYEDCKPNNNETFEGNIANKFTAVSAKNATEDEQAQTTLNSSNILSSEYGNYYLLQESQKSALGIEGVSQDVLVSVKDRKVVSYLGLKWKNKMYYTIDDQSGEGIGEVYNVEYRNPNTNAPTIAVTGRTVYYGDTAKNVKYRFTVDITQGSHYINKGDLYYGKVENGNVKSWNKTADNTFLVDREGTYKIYYKDAADNVSNEVEYVIEPKTTLIDGSSFNIKMKTLAGATSATVDTVDTNITNFKYTTIKPNNSILIDNNKVSTSNSQYPIFMWFDNGTIYLWSEENWIYMNSNSACMFNKCSNIISLDFDNFNTDNVKLMYFMFQDCNNLKSLDVSNFNTSNVTSMTAMFTRCRNLTELDVSKFNTDKVTSMQHIFYGCSGLKELDLRSFNTENVTNMWLMFYNCKSLQTIYVSSSYKTLKVTNSLNMFLDCPKLVGGSGTAYNSSNTDATYAHIDGGTSNPGYFTRKE